MSLSPSADPVETPTLRQIFLSFAKISLSSFGGGLSGWMLRELVHDRKWLSEDDFMAGLSLAQAFPGVNIVNLSIWLGYHWRGGRGAFLAASGVVVPPMFVGVLALTAFEHLSQHRSLQVALAGVAAVAIALSFTMGFRALYRSARSVLPVVFAVVTFSAIFFWRVPLYIVVGGMAPLSIGLAYLRLSKRSAA